MQANKLFILRKEDKGRCVCAGTPFEPGDLIEICPVIVISAEERKSLHETSLHDYYFVWGENHDQAAIALGYGSLYNHSSNPNAQFVNEPEDQTIIIECISKIGVGDEILINYVDGHYKEKLWFKEK